MQVEYHKRADRDFLPEAEIRLFDTGHLALEEHLNEIALLTRDFLGRTIKNG
ncbi:hypothetical protein RsS62_57400 [Rhizobium dioscoreae]|uniref:Uncharacterized protein n=1 Tax=Rhizobium dioscoreae TaxID=2653122 RepID=A0ABQ0ZED7_9HYPH|nr:hypothetical protein RsS62_57400 [Rhizobium dioscoreae]GES53722.1 hypothetical protein RsS93_63360 [Rhizobium dioscoreae]GLU85224.1 hypothetical protein Rhsp01_64000 [Rhizobium sp. NBRC 114257]